MNLAKDRAQVEAHHGMELLADYVAWIKEVGAQIVAEENGKRVSEVERYETLFKRLADTKVQEAAIEAQLSFTVVCELSSASYAIRNRKDRASLGESPYPNPNPRNQNQKCQRQGFHQKQRRHLRRGSRWSCPGG